MTPVVCNRSAFGYRSVSFRVCRVKALISPQGRSQVVTTVVCNRSAFGYRSVSVRMYWVEAFTGPQSGQSGRAPDLCIRSFPDPLGPAVPADKSCVLFVLLFYAWPTRAGSAGGQAVRFICVVALRLAHSVSFYGA